jgi:hypothetical protein
MRQARGWLLRVVLASIVVNAAFGIYALVGPHLGRRADQVLATSACVTGAGIFTLACLPAWERRRLRLVAVVGIVASILGFGMLALGAWLRTDNSTYWKVAGTAVVVASFAVLVSLLALARLPASYRAVSPAAVALAAVLAGMIVFAVWDGNPSSTYGRAMGVVAVLLAAATVATPVLHRAARSEPAAEPPPAGAELRFCPSCGRPVGGVEAAPVSCSACGARFRVEFGQ